MGSNNGSGLILPGSRQPKKDNDFATKKEVIAMGQNIYDMVCAEHNKAMNDLANDMNRELKYTRELIAHELLEVKRFSLSYRLIAWIRRVLAAVGGFLFPVPAPAPSPVVGTTAPPEQPKDAEPSIPEEAIEGIGGVTEHDESVQRQGDTPTAAG